MALYCFCLSLFFFSLLFQWVPFYLQTCYFQEALNKRPEWKCCFAMDTHSEVCLLWVHHFACTYITFHLFFLSPCHFKSAIKQYCQANLTATYFQNRSSHSSFPLHFSPHCPWMHSSLPTLFKVLSPMWHLSKPIQLTKPAEKSSFF